MNLQHAVRSLTVALLVFPAMAVRADDGAPERPWAAGVNPDDQRAALALFQEGNALLKDSAFVPAAAKYREALKLWDHPAIHYNLVLALLNLDQPLEVRQHLQSAMRYGPAPIDQEKFEQAKAYMALVDKQLSQLTITCDESGASVTLDGRTLFTAPGKFQDYVRAGPHSVVASKEGFITNTVARSFPGGDHVDLELKLVSAADATAYRRRFAQWIPWTVGGAGLAVAAIGGLLQFEGVQNINTYDNYPKTQQATCVPGGCVPSASVAGNKNSGAALQAAAMGFYGVGGAAVVTGVVLLYVNRLQPYTPDDLTKKVEVSLVPVFSPHLGGLSASIQF